MDQESQRKSLRLSELPARGLGVELRLHGCDPDRAVQAAKAGGYRVLELAQDKAHGTREAYILDPDGYTWVPDRPLRPNVSK